MPPRNSLITSGVTTSFSPFSGCRLPSATRRGRLARHRADQLLQLANAGLARVMPRDKTYRFGRDLEHTLAETILLNLPRNQVGLRNRDLLPFRIAVSSMISIRSSNGPGIVSSWLAVQIKRTLLKSNG